MHNVRDLSRIIREDRLYDMCSDVGLTLVEILVAISILSILAIGFLGFAIQSLQSVSYNAQRVQALALARKVGIELRDGKVGVLSQSLSDRTISIRGITYTWNIKSGSPIRDDPLLAPYRICVSWKLDYQVSLDEYIQK